MACVELRVKYQNLGCGKQGGSADALSVAPSHKEQAKTYHSSICNISDISQHL